MNKEELFETLSDIDEKNVKNAREYKHSKFSKFQRFGALVAVAAVAIVAIAVTPLFNKNTEDPFGIKYPSSMKTVLASYPAPIGGGMTSEEFAETDEYWDSIIALRDRYDTTMGYPGKTQPACSSAASINTIPAALAASSSKPFIWRKVCVLDSASECAKNPPESNFGMSKPVWKIAADLSLFASAPQSDAMPPAARSASEGLPSAPIAASRQFKIIIAASGLYSESQEEPSKMSLFQAPKSPERTSASKPRQSKKYFNSGSKKTVVEDDSRAIFSLRRPHLPPSFAASLASLLQNAASASPKRAHSLSKASAAAKSPSETRSLAAASFSLAASASILLLRYFF